MSVCNETADLEEPCVGVVENNDLILTDEQTKVHKIQHERLISKSELKSHQAIKKSLGLAAIRCDDSE